MKQSLRITRRAFCCIATIALIVFSAWFSAAKDFGSPPAKQPSIIGTWVAEGKAPNEGVFKVTYVFKADNTLLWMHEEIPSSGPKALQSFSAKYRIDYSTKPIQLDLFDFNDPRAPRDYAQRCILEFEGESRFRMDSKMSGERPEEFGKDTLVFTKEEVSAAAEHPSIIGTWSSQIGLKWTLVFKADNTVRVTVGGSSFSAKYTIDYSTKPIHLDLFDYNPPSSYAKDKTWRTILEFEGESRFRLDTKNFVLDPKVSGARPEEFGKNPIVLTKEEVSAAAEHPSIIGTWVAEESFGADVIKITYVFKADNTMLWTGEMTGGGPKESDSYTGKYTVDYSTKPIQIDMFDITFKSGEKERRGLGILEFESESRVRFAVPLQFGDPRPKGFETGCMVFTKVE